MPASSTSRYFSRQSGSYSNPCFFVMFADNFIRPRVKFMTVQIMPQSIAPMVFLFNWFGVDLFLVSSKFK